MRQIKALVLGLAILLSSSVVMAYDDPTIAGWENKSKLAQQVRQGTQVTVLKLVRNANEGNDATSIASQDIVVYDTVSDDGITVALTTTSADGAIAGVAVTSIPTSDTAGSTSAQADAGLRNWGWILVHGKTNAKTGTGGANNAQTGDPFITSTDSGAVTTFPNRTSNVPVTAAGGQKLTNTGGFFLDNDAQGTSSEVFVQLE